MVFRIKSLWNATNAIYDFFFNPERRNKVQWNKMLYLGFGLAVINGGFYGYLAFGTKDSLPGFITNNKLICIAFLLIGSTALGISSIAANYDSWYKKYSQPEEDQTKPSAASKSMPNLYKLSSICPVASASMPNLYKSSTTTISPMQTTEGDMENSNPSKTTICCFG